MWQLYRVHGKPNSTVIIDVNRFEFKWVAGSDWTPNDLGSVVRQVLADAISDNGAVVVPSDRDITLKTECDGFNFQHEGDTHSAYDGKWQLQFVLTVQDGRVTCDRPGVSLGLPDIIMLANRANWGLDQVVKYEVLPAVS